MLGNGGEDMDGQAGRMRIVDGDELNPRIHQRGDECQIARQAIQLRDHKSCLVAATGLKRPLQFGSIVALAALDFGMLGDQ